MVKCYVSCGFHETEKQWGDWAAKVIDKADHRSVWFGQGSDTPKAALEQAQQEMPDCSGLVAFVHRRDNDQMPPGVRDELVLAANQDVPILAFWESGVESGGLLGQAVILRESMSDLYADNQWGANLIASWLDKLGNEEFVEALMTIAAVGGGLWFLSKLSEQQGSGYRRPRGGGSGPLGRP